MEAQQLEDATERSPEVGPSTAPNDIECTTPANIEQINSEAQEILQAEALDPPLVSAKTEAEPTVAPKTANASPQLQYTRETLLELKNKPECQSPPKDWDLSHSSELYEPGNKLKPHSNAPHAIHGQPVPDVDMSAQQRKDSWRGKPVSASLAQGSEGPIRSRLVENGYLGEADPAKAVRQGSAPRAWPQQDEAQGSAYSGPPVNANRPVATGGSSWRGPPVMHGRGPGGPSEGRERQWGGRGPHPLHAQANAGHVDIPSEQSGKATEGVVPQARSLEKDWRASKGKPGSAPGPSSKEWANYRSQAHEGQSRPPGASEPAERQPQPRQRHGSNNPEWMVAAAGAGSEDASGLSAAARRAKDFEAERQQMKEKWKQEQAQLRGAAHQPVSMAEFMTDEDLEALKTAAGPETANAGVGTQLQDSPADASQSQTAERPGCTSSGQTFPSGLSQPMQQSNSFDFRSLAQAASQGLPPMPKGVATLEDLERRARAPPGFGGHPHLPPKASQVLAGTHTAASLPPGSPTGPKSAPRGASETPPADTAALQEPGKAFLSLLSNASPAAASAQQPVSTAMTPPPGFPASSKPQGSISWGSSSQLQGIWGAPTPSSTGSQATWGAPASAARSNSTEAQLPKAYSLQSPTAEQGAGETHLQGWPSTGMGSAATPPGSLPGQPMQGSFGPAGQPDPQHRAGSVSSMQPETDGIRGSMASNASNPLLALLGQHRSSVAQGGRGEQDPQLQAFLQAQSGAYSWHPPQAAPKPQMQIPMLPQQQQQQHQQQYLGQPARPLSNAALSQDLLRQLQLGQSRMQAAAPPSYPQLAHLPGSGLHAYQQAGHGYAQPRSGGLHAHDQSNLQAAQQYNQQHQLPGSLGGAMPRTAYGHLHNQGLSGQQHAHHSQVPGQSFPYSLTSQANTHLGMDGQQYSSHPTPGSQPYGNNDLASQMLLQRLQQQSYSQPPQRGSGLDRFFNPTAYNRSQHAHVPPLPGMQASLAELEAMMARQ